jgi:capsular exopolysaccharide synthesis family protein
MGEIADALRRADPIDSPPREPNHRRERDSDRSDTQRAPTADPVIHTQPPIETEQKPLERPTVLPLLGNRSDMLEPARVCLDDPQGHYAQQYRRLAIRLRRMANSRNAHSIVVTSAQAGDGKTTTACNLAISLAMTDHTSRVVLVDLDLHRSRVASALGIRIDTPVDAVLRGEVTVEQATMETDVNNLSILAASSGAEQPEKLLAHHSLADMTARLESQFDWVIIDTPPVLATSDAQVVLQHADVVLLVARAGVSQTHALRNALEYLPKDKVLASFLNSSQTKSQQHGYYDDYYRSAEDLKATASEHPKESHDFDVERN